MSTLSEAINAYADTGFTEASPPALHGGLL